MTETETQYLVIVDAIGWPVGHGRDTPSNREWLEQAVVYWNKGRAKRRWIKPYRLELMTDEEMAAASAQPHPNTEDGHYSI